MQPLNRNTNPKRFESIRLNAALAGDQYPANRCSYPFSKVAQDKPQTAVCKKRLAVVYDDSRVVRLTSRRWRRRWHYLRLSRDTI